VPSVSGHDILPQRAGLATATGRSLAMGGEEPRGNERWRVYGSGDGADELERGSNAKYLDRREDRKEEANEVLGGKRTCGKDATVKMYVKCKSKHIIVSGRVWMAAR
jgi:hypothetical protein